MNKTLKKTLKKIPTKRMFPRIDTIKENLPLIRARSQTCLFTRVAGVLQTRLTSRNP